MSRRFTIDPSSSTALASDAVVASSGRLHLFVGGRRHEVSAASVAFACRIAQMIAAARHA